jgi:hypothetical protein
MQAGQLAPVLRSELIQKATNYRLAALPENGREEHETAVSKAPYALS